MPKRSVSRAGSLTQIRSGLRWTIRSFGCRVSAANGSATVDVAIGSVASTIASYMPSTSLPTRLAPSQSTFLGPASSGPENGVATHLPFFVIRTRTSAGAASENLNEIWSARPSAFGEKASLVAATFPSVRVTASCVDAVAMRPPVAFAASSIRKIPSGSGAGSKRSTCSPARFHVFGNVDDLRAEHVENAHGHVRGRVQGVRDRRAVGDRVPVRRDRLRVGREPGDRERDVAAADHALGRRDAVVRSGSRTSSCPARPPSRPTSSRRWRPSRARTRRRCPRRRRRRPSRAAATDSFARKRTVPGTVPVIGRRIELRQPDPRDLAGDRVEQVVERRARAVGEAGVAMTGDGAQEDGQTRAEAGVAAGDERLRRGRVDVRDVEAPGEERGQRAARLRGDRERAVLAEHRHADGAGVESLRVRADDVALAPAVAALVDGAEAVDEEVVADVVPAVPLHVVELDRPDDRRRLGRGVAVRARRVVDDRDPEVGGERRPGAPDLLVGLPARARHDRGRTRLLQRPRRHTGGGARDEPGAQAADLPALPVLDPIGRPDPPRVAEPPAAAAGALGGAGVRTVLRLRRRVLPGAPAPARRACAELHRAGAAPVQADQVEAGRRVRRRRACARRRAARRARRSSPPAPAPAPAERGRVR